MPSLTMDEMHVYAIIVDEGECGELVIHARYENRGLALINVQRVFESLQQKGLIVPNHTNIGYKRYRVKRDE